MKRILAAIAVLAVPALAAAAVPDKLGYQGRLLRADGAPESGVVQVRFALFDAAQSGGVLWEEEQVLALSDGYYATLLGEKTALSSSLFDGRDLFLEMSVGGTPLTPRQRLASVAFALRAVDATNVSGGKVTASEIWVGTSKVFDADGKLAAGAAYTAGAGLKLTGNTFSLIDSCKEGEVLHFSGGAWVCAPDGGNTYAAGAGLKLADKTFSLIDTCSSGQVLKYTGSTWACGADESGGQGATTQAPITGSGAFNNPISITQSSATANGYLSSDDWKAFNAKVGSVSAGPGLLVSGTTAVTVAADFGSGAGKVVEGNDPRLTDKRDPKAGSADYIQNQSASAQNASLNISGSALVGGKLGIGGASARPLDVSATALNVGLTSPAGQTRLILGNRDSAAIPSIIAADNGNLRLGKGTSYSAADGGTLTDSLFIGAGGNVGVGTTSPGQKLEVAGKVAATEFIGSAAGLTNIPASVTGATGRYFKLYDQDDGTAPSNPLITACGTRGNHVACFSFQLLSANHCDHCYSGGPKAIIYTTGNIPFTFHTSGAGVYLATDDPGNFMRFTSSYGIKPTPVSALPAGAQLVGKLN